MQSRERLHNDTSDDQVVLHFHCAFRKSFPLEHSRTSCTPWTVFQDGSYETISSTSLLGRKGSHAAWGKWSAERLAGKTTTRTRPPPPSYARSSPKGAQLMSSSFPSKVSLHAGYMFHARERTRLPPCAGSILRTRKRC